MSGINATRATNPSHKRRQVAKHQLEPTNTHFGERPNTNMTNCKQRRAQNTKLKTRWHKSKLGEHIRTWMSQMKTNRKLANVRRHMDKYHAEHARTDFGKRHHNRMSKRKQCRTQHIHKNTGPRKVPCSSTKNHVRHTCEKNNHPFAKRRRPTTRKRNRVNEMCWQTTQR